MKEKLDCGHIPEKDQVIFKHTVTGETACADCAANDKRNKVI